MSKLLNLMAMTVGGWIGWEVGSLVSVFTGFVVSMVGSGGGLYLANRFVQRYRP